MRSTFLALLLSASAALGIERVTMTVTVTNLPETGDTFTINSAARYWTNVLSSGTILTNAAGTTNNFIQSSTTNLWNAVVTYPFAGNLYAQWLTATQFTLLGQWEGNLIGDQSGDWAAFSYSTQTVSESYPVKVPAGNQLTASQGTNLMSLLASDLSSRSTNQIAPAAAILAAFARETNGLLEKPVIQSPYITNLTNYGNAITSPGTNSGSEQFGAAADASGNQSLAVGQQATASGAYGTAIGRTSQATGQYSTALGNESEASGTNSMALGIAALADAMDAIALGNSADAGHSNSVALGNSVATTAVDQLMLGSSAHTVVVPGVLSAASQTNSILGGTNQVSGAIAFSRSAVSTVADGNNTVAIPDNATFVSLTGSPSATWTNCAMSGALWDGRFIILDNATGQNMTVAHESGFDGTAARRILTSTAADVVTTGRRVTLWIYNATTARWLMITP